MEPIVSPWILYLIALAGNLDSYLKVIGVLSFLGAIIIGPQTEKGKHETKQEEQGLTTLQTFLTLVSLGCFFINIFVPSKETCYQMLIAKYITPDNLVFFKGEAVNLIDYIVKQVHALKN